MTGASFDGTLNAESLQVGGDLLMASDDEHKAGFTDVYLKGATITGQIDMTGASFNGNLYANALQVGSNLHMASDDKHKASFKRVELTDAKISGAIDMNTASFDSALNADSLQVSGYLSLAMHAVPMRSALPSRISAVIWIYMAPLLPV
jgi:uncharacterized protein YjbI with pentapeptide repeats